MAKKGVLLRINDPVWVYNFLSEVFKKETDTLWSFDLDYLAKQADIYSVDLKKVFEDLIPSLKNNSKKEKIDIFYEVIVSQLRTEIAFSDPEKAKEMANLLKQTLSVVSSFQDKEAWLSAVEHAIKDLFRKDGRYSEKYIEDMTRYYVNIAYNIAMGKHKIVFISVIENDEIKDYQKWFEIQKSVIDVFNILKEKLNFGPENFVFIYNKSVVPPDFIKGICDEYSLDIDVNELYNTLSQREYFWDSSGLILMYGYLYDNMHFINASIEDFSLREKSYIKMITEKYSTELGLNGLEKFNLKTEKANTENSNYCEVLSPFLWLKIARWFDKNDMYDKKAFSNALETIKSPVVSETIKDIRNCYKKIEEVFFEGNFEEYIKKTPLNKIEDNIKGNKKFIEISKGSFESFILYKTNEYLKKNDITLVKPVLSLINVYKKTISPSIVFQQIEKNIEKSYGRSLDPQEKTINHKPMKIEKRENGYKL